MKNIILFILVGIGGFLLGLFTYSRVYAYILKEFIKNLKTDSDYNTVFATRKEAETVLTLLDDLVLEYGNATVSDFKDIQGITPCFKDTQFGWTDIRNATIKLSRGGYTLTLPRPKLLH